VSASLAAARWQYASVTQPALPWHTLGSRVGGPVAALRTDEELRLRVRDALLLRAVADEAQGTREGIHASFALRRKRGSGLARARSAEGGAGRSSGRAFHV